MDALENNNCFDGVILNERIYFFIAPLRPVVSVYPEKYPVRLHLHLTSFSLGRLPDDFPKDAEFVRC